MNIVVCIKQVPDTTEVRMDPVTNTIVRDGIPKTVNPFDKHAIEAAVELKETCGGTVTAITMGPLSAGEALRECYALGADRLVLVSDNRFGGSDTFSTAYILAEAIKAHCPFDLIICGKQAIDGDTAQVGPELAERLNIPQLTYASSIECAGEKITALRELDEAFESTEAVLPALVTVVRTINEPRCPHISRILQAYKEEILILTFDDLPDIDPGKVGIDGSPTKVFKINVPSYCKQARMISCEDSAEAAHKLLYMLAEVNLDLKGIARNG
ncbi:MAG: electron transfer flavoprotein beta subunit/FixA family protein [Bacteroidia bacterium]|nr:electron transfer flavoprotein beta subunit/FixA family protein [Bacteroidia bacterium]